MAAIVQKFCIKVLAATLGFLLFPVAVLRAETVDYTTDKVLCETRVDMTSLHDNCVTLAELFSFVEARTNLKFVYFSERIHAERRVTLELTGSTSLTQLFSTLSSMSKLVFLRNNQTVIVRSPISNNDLSQPVNRHES